MRPLGLGMWGNVAGQGGGGGTPYSIPNYYTTTSVFPFAVIDNGNGTFSSTFAAANFKDAGGPFYISPSGDDTTGTGAIGAPWRTISKALTTAASGSLINMAAGRYAPPAPTDGAGKLMSFVAATLGTVFVGNLLANADVSSWGSPASGRQQITLTTGYIAGFVDTTKTDPTSTVLQTSLNATSAANIATFQAASQCAIYRPAYFSGTTASTLGAFDGRDLTNTFDTTLLAWRVGTPTTYFTGSTGGKLYFENLVFVGEQVFRPGIFTTRITLNNCNYIGGDNLISGISNNLGVVAIHNMIAVGCQGSGSPASDMIDLNNVSVLENVTTYYPSLGAGDSAFTAHNASQMLINCTMGGQWASTGRQGRQGYFGGTYTSTNTTLRFGLVSPFSIDAHLKGVSLAGAPSSADVGLGTLPNNVALYNYDSTTLAGKTVTGGTPISRAGNKPATQQTLLLLDPGNLSTLFQDTGGTTPVTADGQEVARINCAAGTGGFITRTTGAGTAVYHTDGTYSWVLLTTARFTMNAAAPFTEDTSIIFGINSTDTNFILTGLDSSFFVDFRATGNPYNNCLWTVSANGGFAVNAGTPSSLATIKSTACNGSNNVFTMRRADLMYTPWRTAALFCGPTAGTSSLDGKMFGARFVAWGSDAEIKAAEQAMGLKMGTVIP